MQLKEITQKGTSEKGLLESRLYCYPNEKENILHLLYIGDKKTQKIDINNCKKQIEMILKNGKIMAKYNSIEEMIIKQDHLSNKEKTETLDFIADRTLVRILQNLRVRKNLTQSQLAKKMKVTQATISNIEAKEDNDLKVSEIYQYIKATNIAMKIEFHPIELKLKDRITIAISELQVLLDSFFAVNKEDEKITFGTCKHTIESLRIIMSLVEKTAEKIENEMSKVEKNKSKAVEPVLEDVYSKNAMIDIHTNKLEMI